METALLVLVVLMVLQLVVLVQYCIVFEDAKVNDNYTKFINAVKFVSGDFK